MSKEQNRKKRDKPMKPGDGLLELVYQSSFERLLADIIIKLKTIQFRS